MKKILLFSIGILVLGGLAFALSKSTWLKGEFEETGEVTEPDLLPNFSIEWIFYNENDNIFEARICADNFYEERPAASFVFTANGISAETEVEFSSGCGDYSTPLDLRSSFGINMVGDYEVTVKVDSTEMYVESDELDNSFSSTLTLPKNQYLSSEDFDLSISTVAYDFPSSTIQAEFCFTGESYHNNNDLPLAYTVTVNETTVLEEQKVSTFLEEVTGYGNSCETIDFDASTLLSGVEFKSLSISMTLDPDSGIMEANELNNTYAGTMEVLGAPEPVEEEEVVEKEEVVEEIAVETSTGSSGGGGGGGGSGSSSSSSSSSSNDEDEEDEEVEKLEKQAFTDIEDHWAEDYINELYDRDAVSGYSDGRFGPDDPVTRAQIVKIALLAFDHELETDFVNIFSDIPTSEWYTNYVLSAAFLDIVSGYDDDTFRPNNNVTRAEAVKIILVAGGITEFSSKTPNFSDVNISSDWFAKYTAYAKSSGLVGGYSDGTFRGNQSITRAEVCKIVVELLAK